MEPFFIHAGTPSPRTEYLLDGNTPQPRKKRNKKKTKKARAARKRTRAARKQNR